MGAVQNKDCGKNKAFGRVSGSFLGGQTVKKQEADSKY